MSGTLRALSLTQPWATLVALGHKRLETRSWRTYLRGTIAIHAAKGMPEYARAFAEQERVLGTLTAAAPRGVIVATATLMGCRPTEAVVDQIGETERRLSDYTPGRWAWFLTDITPLEQPIPCRGMQGLWIVPPEIAALIKRTPARGLRQGA